MDLSIEYKEKKYRCVSNHKTDNEGFMKLDITPKSVNNEDKILVNIHDNETIDMILISSPLLDRGVKDFSNYKMFQAMIFNKRFLSDKKGKFKGYPFRSFSNGGYTGGYSDHYPVYMYLIKEKK